MNPDAWTERLRAFGFTNYEARIYLALLGENSLNVADIVRKSGVPQPKIYEATRNLCERGFAEQVVGDVKAYRAIQPTVAFENYRVRTERELAQQSEAMKTLQAELPGAPKLSADARGIRIVQGAVNIRAARLALSLNAKEEVIHMIRPPIWAGANPSKGIVSEALPFKMYRLLEASLLDLPVHGAAYSFMAATEEFTRVVPSLPTKAAIYDRKVIAFPLRDEDEGTLMILPEPNVAENWARWAVKLWESAPAYGAARKSPKARPASARPKSR